MSHSYSTVRKTSGGRTIVPTRAAVVKSHGGVQLINGIGGAPSSASSSNSATANSGSTTKVTIVETVGDQIVSRVEQESTDNANNSGDSLQLMGMSGSTLPTSNLFVNYPHAMWERNSEGNRIPVTVVKAEGGSAVASSPDDILSQAAASIKTENESDSPTRVTITMPSAGADVSPAAIAGSAAAGLAPGSRIIVTKQPNNTNNSGDVPPRPHVCEVCTKTFAKREHLTKHLRIHKSDNKRYSCEYCQKAFRDRYELVRHTRRHTGDFPFR